MDNEKILIIDDEEDMLESCSRILERKHYKCITSSDPSEAIRIASVEHPTLVLTDLKMPKKDGMEVLKELKEIDPSIIVVVFTAYASVSSAVEAIKEGAFDFISKPFSSDQLLVSIERALNHKRLAEENRNLRTQIESTCGLDKIIGNSAAIKNVFEIVKKVAATDANILLYGESGTGKELTARSIHLNSNRRDRAFVPVDCITLSENILESELFGHERGAFTGASIAKQGLFELADKGTIFLDEIGKINLSMQAKLLRVLQERQLRKVGGSSLIDVDFRVISSTNIDLNKAIEEEKFIEDLFWRLNVITIEIPPLRERREDIDLLANHFIDEFSEKSGKDIKGISKEAMEILKKYDWPGNIRELQNVIERAMSLTDSNYIASLDLPDHVLGGTDSGSYIKNMPFKLAKRKWLDAFEKKYFADILKESNGNISRAAQKAGIDRKTIYRIFKKHGMEINS
jgi:DNA-binding NtrC family response regulator